MIEHNTPALPPTQQIIRFNNYWQGIIAVAWTNIHIKLVQLDNSVMKQQHKNDSSVTSPIIGDTSDSCNVNNKLSKYNCLGKYFISYRVIIRVISVYLLIYKFPCDKE